MDIIKLPSSNSIFAYFQSGKVNCLPTIDNFTKESQAILMQLMFTAVSISKLIRASDWFSNDSIKDPDGVVIYIRKDVVGEVKVDKFHDGIQKTVVKYIHDWTKSHTVQRFGESDIELIPIQRLENVIHDMRKISTLCTVHIDRFKEHFERLEKDFKSLESYVKRPDFNMKIYDSFHKLIEYYRSVIRAVGELIKFYSIESTRYQKTLSRFIEMSISYLEEKETA